MNLTIRSRIYAGYALLSLFIIIIGMIAYNGSVKIEQGFKLYSEANDLSDNINKIDISVSDLQRDVQNYIYTGYTTLAENVFHKLRVLGNDLTSVQSTDSVILDYLSRMEGYLKKYQQTFIYAVDERKKRSELVEQNKLIVAQLQQKISLKNNAFRIITNTQKNLYEYLNDPEILKVNNALKSLEKEIVSHGDSSLKEDLINYKKNVFNIVQSTRGFLYLLSVVMAAEAQEFAYFSKKLKSYVLEKIEPVKTNHENEKKNIQAVVLVASVLLLIISLILSFIISSSINNPLSSLTETFRKLANNEDVESIPGLDLTDEIGQMSKAAEVFRQKNMETNELVAELDQKKKDLEHSNEELDQFVYTVSHDLKSPIVTSMGFIGMMKELAAANQVDMVMKKIPTLEKANKKMGQLIDDLLNLSRLGRIDEEKEEVDIKRVVENVINLHEHSLKKNKIKLNITGDFPSIIISETRISQVFENLLSNAIKYCENDNPEITIGAHEDRDSYKFFVKDNGPGIAKEYHAKVFNLFQRLKNDTKGTGIGLAIVHKILNSLGGKVWIESGEGIEGCTFWLELPKSKELKVS